jgi:hypothetical protein
VSGDPQRDRQTHVKSERRKELKARTAELLERSERKSLERKPREGATLTVTTDHGTSL